MGTARRLCHRGAGLARHLVAAAGTGARSLRPARTEGTGSAARSGRATGCGPHLCAALRPSGSGRAWHKAGTDARARSSRCAHGRASARAVADLAGVLAPVEYAAAWPPPARRVAIPGRRANHRSARHATNATAWRSIGRCSLSGLGRPQHTASGVLSGPAAATSLRPVRCVDDRSKRRSLGKAR